MLGIYRPTKRVELPLSLQGQKGSKDTTVRGSQTQKSGVLSPKNPYKPQTLNPINPKPPKGTKALVAEWIHFAHFGIILPTIN